MPTGLTPRLGVSTQATSASVATYDAACSRVPAWFVGVTSAQPHPTMTPPPVEQPPPLTAESVRADRRLAGRHPEGHSGGTRHAQRSESTMSSVLDFIRKH